jgi:group II intron reverse transcriptase/maturase
MERQRTQKTGQPAIGEQEMVNTRNASHGQSRTAVTPPEATQDKEVPSVTLEQIFSRPNMLQALQRVERNKGAAGIDDIEVSELREHLKANWPRIKSEIMDGSYRPLPVRKVEIPKPAGGLRRLGIPTCMDRLIQQAIAQILTPIFDPLFSANSFGFRPGKNAHMAILQAKEFAAQGNSIVVDIDLEKFFDKVNHDLLMNRISRKIKDPCTLKLIHKFLKAGILANGTLEKSTQGTPQGSPLSPLLSNIMLDDLDKELEKRGHKFCRYADDCNIYVKTKRAGDRVYQSVKSFLEGKLKLKVNENKSAVDWAWKRKFLGFRLLGVKAPKISIAKESIKRFKDKVRIITKGHRRQNLEQRLASLTMLSKGWMQYFKIADTRTPFKDLDSWIRHRLRMCLLKQWWRPRTRVKMLMKHGLPREKALMYSKVKRHWFLADTKYMNFTFNVKFFEERGYHSLCSML